MTKDNKIEEELDVAVDLLRRLLAVELYKSGTTMDVIAKNLHISKSKVVEMLDGVKKENGK